MLEPGRGTNGYREYTDDAILAVGQIRGLLEAGLSTKDIGCVLPCATGAAPDLEPAPSCWPPYERACTGSTSGSTRSPTPGRPSTATSTPPNGV